MGRFSFYWEYLGPLRKWLVAACVAMSTIFGVLPDQAKARFYYFSPNWRWQTWLLIAALLLCAFILEEAHYRYLVAEAHKSSTEEPRQTLAFPLVSAAAIALIWVLSVILQSAATKPVSTVTPTPPSKAIPSEIQTSTPSPSSKGTNTASKNQPRGNSSKKPRNISAVDSKPAPTQTQTQTETQSQQTQPQTPSVAIAPNGIANAAPNLGTQTVNNFGELPSPPLALTDEQCQAITETLKPFKPQTVALSAVGSMASDPFTSEFRKCIEAAGLTVNYSASGIVLVAGIGTPPPGISFVFGDNRKDILYALSNELRSLGIVNKPMKAFASGNAEGAADAFGIFVSPLQ